MRGKGLAATVMDDAYSGTKAPSALSVGHQLAEAREAHGLERGRRCQVTQD